MHAGCAVRFSGRLAAEHGQAIAPIDLYSAIDFARCQSMICAMDELWARHFVANGLGSSGQFQNISGHP
jgi:hypothetical protein